MVSDFFLKQTSMFAQAFIMQALARAVAAALSRALLVGTGSSGQPTGVFNAPGITTVAGTSASYDTVLEMISAVEAASALLTPASAGFVLPASIAQTLRATEKATGSGMVMVRIDLAGYPGIVTEATSPSTLPSRIGVSCSCWNTTCWKLAQILTGPQGVRNSMQGAWPFVPCGVWMRCC